ncbi:hypothetical protein P4639_14285 [Priestia megaterium]|nr:hypothetical protein [Priestia megaterium]
MSEKKEQFIEGYAWLSENKEVVLRYLEAIEQGYYHESILKVRN